MAIPISNITPKVPATAPSLGSSDVDSAEEKASTPSFHPRDQYLNFMVKEGKMDREGSLQISGKEKFFLSKVGLANFQRFLQEKQQLGAFEWSLNPFLQKLLEYLSKSFKGTQVELASGALYLVGKDGWITTWEEKWNIDKQLPSEIWNFCREKPSCFEIHIVLPQKTQNLENFLEFCTYLIAIQAFPSETLSYIESLREFGHILHPNPNEPIEEKTFVRMQKVQQMIMEVKKFTRIRKLENRAIFEVPFLQTHLQIFFDLVPTPLPIFQLHHVRLKLFHDGGDYPRIEMATGSLEAIHDLLLQRLVPLRSSKDPEVVGAFWAFLTLLGRVIYSREAFVPANYVQAFQAGRAYLNSNKDCLLAYTFHALAYLSPQQLPDLQVRQEELQTQLARFLFSHMLTSYKETVAVLTFVGHLANSRLTTNGREDQIEIFCPEGLFYLVLPDHLDFTLEYLYRWLKLDLSGCRNCLLEALKIFFPKGNFNPSIQGLKKQSQEFLEEIFQALESGPPFEEVIITDDPERISRAWTQQRSPDAPLMRAILPHLTVKSLPIVANGLTLVTPTSDRFRLTIAYIEHLKTLPKAIGLTYFPVWLDQLENLMTQDPPSDSWDQLLRLQTIATDLDQKEIFEKFFDKILSSELSSRKGFAAFMNGIFEGLKEKRNYQRILHLLNQICIPKGDTVLHPWYQICLEKTSKTEAVEEIEKSVAYVSNDLLFQFLEELIKTPQKDEKIRSRIQFLKGQIEPKPEEQPRFLNCLLSYYPHLLEVGQPILVIDDVRQHFSLFRSQKETRFLPFFTRAISQINPKDEKVWQKVLPLIEQLRHEDAYTETVLEIFEILTAESFLRVASFRDAPFQVFHKGIPSFEKKLTDPQKNRLRKVFAAFVIFSQKEKKEMEMLSFFPSLDWVFSLLQTEETQGSYAGLFLDLATKGKIDPKNATFCKSMFWIAPHILTSDHQDMLSRFRTFLTRIPQKDLKTKEWRQMIAGICAKPPFDPTSRDLLQTLTVICNPDEKKFFENCRTLYSNQDFPALQNVLSFYHKTGVPLESESRPKTTVQEDPRSKIEKILKQNSPHSLNQILTLLEKYHDDDFDLWEKLFSLIKNKPEISLRAWNLWMRKHPVEKVSPQDGKYWFQAIQHIFTVLEPSEIHVFDDFFLPYGAPLLERLTDAPCRDICSLFLKLAINSSWDGKPLSYGKKLRATFALINNKKIQSKIPDPLGLIDTEFRIRFAILLLYSKDQSLVAVGHVYTQAIIELAMTENPDSEVNRVLLTNYAEKPYVPHNPRDQENLYRWLERSWNSNKYLLSWNQVCKLLHGACLLTVPAFSPEKLYEMWELVVSEMWQLTTEGVILQASRILEGVLYNSLRTESQIILHPAKPFFKATRLILSKLVNNNQIPIEQKIGFIERFNRWLKIYIEKYYSHSNERELCIPILLYHASEALKNIDIRIPRMREVVQTALSDLKTYLPPFAPKLNDDCLAAIEQFILSLPGILSVCVNDLAPVLEVTDVFMQLPRIRKDPPESHLSWTHFLFSFCYAIKKMTPDKIKPVSQLAVALFTHCTQPALLQKRDTIPAKDQKDLIDFSGQVLAYYFLPMEELECLETKDWETLFYGLSEKTLRDLLTELTTDIEKENSSKVYEYWMSASRLIRYAPSLNRDFLSFLYFNCITIAVSKNSSSVFQENILYQLKVRAQFIMAIHSLIEKFKNEKGIENPVLLTLALFNQHRRLVLEFLELYLNHMNLENQLEVTKLFLEIVQSLDLDFLKQIHAIFQFPPDAPALLIPSLQLVITVIEKMIANGQT